MDIVAPILPHAVPFSLVLARVTGLFLMTPMLQGATVPRQVRVMLSVAFAAAIYPTLEAVPFPTADVSLVAYVPILFSELLVGFVLGLFISLPLIALQMGGYIMGYQMGLSLAESFNPELNLQADVLGQLLFIMGSIAFVLIGGFEALFMALTDTFSSMPPGLLATQPAPLDMLVALTTAMTDLALRLAAPVLAVVALVLVTMGIVMKTLPQINVMTIGFTIKIFVGLLAVATAAGVLGGVFDEHLAETILIVRQWAAGG